MKRETLKELGIAEDIIDKIMAENGKDIESAKKPFTDYDDIKKQLGEANTTIEGFKNLDIEGIKKAADDWKAKAEQAEKDAAAKVAEMEFSGRVDSAITAAKGKNLKAVKALLDIDALKASKNQEADIKSALEALKKGNGYLFDAEQVPPPLGAPGAGNTPITPPPPAHTMAQSIKEQLFGGK